MPKFKTEIHFCGDRRFDDPIQITVRADSPEQARLKALRKYYGNSKICVFLPYNPLRGQNPSGQAGVGYEKASAGSAADLSSATKMVRVYMQMA